MFGYIKRKIDQSVEKIITDWDFHYRMNKEADEAIGAQLLSEYSSVDARIDRLIEENIKIKMAEHLKKPDFLAEVVNQLNSLQIKSSDTK